MNPLGYIVIGAAVLLVLIIIIKNISENIIKSFNYLVLAKHNATTSPL